MASEFKIDPRTNALLEGGPGEVTEFIFTVTRSGDTASEASVDVAFARGDTNADDFEGGLPGTQTGPSQTARPARRSSSRSRAMRIPRATRTSR